MISKKNAYANNCLNMTTIPKMKTLKKWGLVTIRNTWLSLIRIKAIINDRQCPACGKNSSQRVFTQKYQWVELCNYCGLGRTLPALEPTNQAERHVKIYSQENYIDNYLTNYAPYLEHSFQRGLDRIKKHKPVGSRLFDIGSGFGFFLNMANADGFIVEGIEVTPYLAEEGNRRYSLNIITGDILDIELVYGKYDIVTAWDVLEHISDVDRFLRKIVHLIKQDGLFLIRVPDFSFMQNNLPREFISSYMTEVYPLGLHQHLYHFSQKSIQEFLFRSGFEIIEQWESQNDEYTPKETSSYFDLLKMMDNYKLSCEINFLCGLSDSS